MLTKSFFRRLRWIERLLFISRLLKFFNILPSFMVYAQTSLNFTNATCLSSILSHKQISYSSYNHIARTSVPMLTYQHNAIPWHTFSKSLFGHLRWIEPLRFIWSWFSLTQILSTLQNNTTFRYSSLVNGLCAITSAFGTQTLWYIHKLEIFLSCYCLNQGY